MSENQENSPHDSAKADDAQSILIAVISSALPLAWFLGQFVFENWIVGLVSALVICSLSGLLVQWRSSAR